MRAINPDQIKDNVIELIGKEWMLVSAGDKEKFNMMTASWGGVGVLWNRPVDRSTGKPIAFVALNPAGRLIKWPLRG